jgi:hypothetical protein
VRQFLPRLKKQLPESCAVTDYSPLELRIQHVKQLEWSVEIGRMQDERIPSRSERDRALEIRFVEPGRLRAAIQLDPFAT